MIGDLMGVMTRKAGENFIITSDRIAGELPSNSAPKKRIVEAYEVWTGDSWSAITTDAKTFTALDVADDYVRANFGLVMGQMAKR